VETVFKALGDTSRLRIVNLLLHGELCVCDIQYVLENSQPNVSRHLAYLKRSKMVLDRRDGYRVFYRLANVKEIEKKRLFAFLRGLFESEDQLKQDTLRLKEAIQNSKSSCLKQFRLVPANESRNSVPGRPAKAQGISHGVSSTGRAEKSGSPFAK
jgi:ArsR family transcriptional regulator